MLVEPTELAELTEQYGAGRIAADVGAPLLLPRRAQVSSQSEFVSGDERYMDRHNTEDSCR